MALDRAYILSEIRRTAEGNGGRALGRGRFAAETGIKPSEVERYWATWGDAVAEAGFEPNALQARYDDDWALSRLVPEVRRLGRIPTNAELRVLRGRDPTFPSRGVFARIGPTRAALARRLVEYCRDRPDDADVLAFAEAADQDSGDGDVGTALPRGQDVFGFVYLLRSGRHYKLGRTNSVGRRERELAIQLPDPARRVHEIRTDDPVGIEAYWHRRFADRRKNGEWFELTADDVRAFKRRRFM